MRMFAGFSGEARQTTVGWSKKAIFLCFRSHVFGTFRDKAKIITQ